jgi:hypothetical protein
MENKTILFSGRFDRPHPGHIITIARLGQKYDKVIVCMLNSLGSHYCIEDRQKIMCDALQYLRGNYQLVVNRHNFEKITQEQIDEIGIKFDAYGSGNYQCNLNMKQLGYEIVDVPRYPGYAARDDKCFQRIMQVIEEEMNRK